MISEEEYNVYFNEYGTEKLIENIFDIEINYVYNMAGKEAIVEISYLDNEGKIRCIRTGSYNVRFERKGNI